MPGRGERGGEGGDVERLDERPGGLQQLVLGALGDDLAAADHDQLVGDHLDLVQQVGGQQHGAAAVGEVAQQAAHPVDAGRVEAVGRLVEDQHLRGRRAARARCRGAGACRGSSCGPGAWPRPGSGRPARASGRRGSSGRPMVRAPRVSTSRPVRPACWAEASSRTPTWRARVGDVAVGWPATVAVPSVAGVSPAMMRIVVDLPAPLGPRKPVTAPGLHSNETSSTARKPP